MKTAWPTSCVVSLATAASPHPANARSRGGFGNCAMGKLRGQPTWPRRQSSATVTALILAEWAHRRNLRSRFSCARFVRDAWANQVEDDGRQIGLGLKFGAGATGIHDYYVAISEAFALLDRGEPLPGELITILNERYAIIKGVLPREQQ